jgi:hypothetical protein
MEPFSLTCHSCAVKLKVVNPHLVGQTLACPKCGTMIHVQHPSGWKPPVPDSVQSQSALSGISSVAPESGESNFEDIDDLLANPGAIAPAGVNQNPKVRAGKTASKSTEKRFQQADSPGNSSEEMKPAINTGTLVDTPILPGEDWASKSARERKKLFLMIGSAVATVMVVAAIIFAIINFGGGEEAPSGQVADVETDVDSVEDSSAADGATSKAGQDSAEADTSDNGFLDETPTGGPVEAISQTGAINDSDSVPNDGSATGFAAPEIGAAPSLEMKDVGAAPSPPNKSTGGLDDVMEATSDDGFQEMNRKMGALAGLLTGSDTSLRDLQDLSVLLSRREAFTLPKYRLEKPKPLKLNLEKLIELPIAGLSAAEPISLAKASRSLTTLTGVPISIDARQISMMGLSINPKLDLKIAEMKLLSASQDLAKQVGLECIVGENSLLLSLPADTKNSKVAIDFPRVGELSADEKQRFVESIKQLIATEIWTKAELPATVSVVDDKILLDCPEGVQRHVRMMIDRINAAAKLANDPSDTTSREVVAARWTASETLREREPGWALSSDRSIGSFLNRIEQIHGLTVLVDWQAALAAGWTPATMVPGEMIEPTVGGTVQELARSMGLSLIGIDAVTVQLTAREIAASALDLEVYPCGDWAAGVESREVEQLMFKALGANIESNFVRVVFEPKCRAVIAVAPQPLQRQIERLIQKLNLATAK